MTAPTPESKVYRVSPCRRLILLVTAVFLLSIALLAGIAVWVAKDQAVVWIGAGVACTFSSLAALFVFIAWYPRLVLSGEGIQVCATITFSTVFIPWDNVERLRLNSGAEGLVLRSPLTSRAAASWRNWANVRIRGVPLYDAEQRQLLQQQRYVPIEVYAYWFKHGDLFEELRGHAPWLADDVESRLAARRREQKANRRILVWVFVASALIGVGAVIAVMVHARLPDEQRAKIEGVLAFLGVSLVWLVAAALSISCLVNLRGARRFARDKQFGYAAFWVLLAITQVLFALALLGTTFR